MVSIHDNSNTSICSGCGVELEITDGPTHQYMTSSPACWEMFGAILAHEYSDYRFLHIHRLTVDTYALQHPGDEKSRKQIQSVGLHLARLHLQMNGLMPPKQSNDAMLGFAKHKSTLKFLEPPRKFSMTVADVIAHAGTAQHIAKIEEWAKVTWGDWKTHHEYIQEWVHKYKT